MPNPKEPVFAGRLYFTPLPPTLTDQAHLALDGRHYPCRPTAKRDANLPSPDQFGQTIELPIAILTFWQKLTGEVDVALQCSFCELLQQTKDDTFTCGHSGQQLVEVE